MDIQTRSPSKVGQRPLWAWAGSVQDFLSSPTERIIKDLTAHLEGLMGFAPSKAQMDAWIGCDDVMRKSFRDICIAKPDVQMWSIIFEYELPLEGGRRPDEVVLPAISRATANGSVQHLHAGNLINFQSLETRNRSRGVDIATNPFCY